MMDELAGLVHYSPVVVSLPKSVEQNDRLKQKPNGMWLTTEDDDGWAAWCRREDFRVESLTVCHDAVIAKDANILVIDEPDKLLKFDAEYCEQPDDYHSVNWSRVAAQYHGIAIIPYCYEYRLSLEINWYYSWDVSSACIWDHNVLTLEARSSFNACAL